MQTETKINFELNNRVLWIDGESVVSEEEMVRRLSQGLSTKGLYVNQITNAIKQFNKHASPEDQVRTKKTLNAALMANVGIWNLPDPYSAMDVSMYVEERLIQECTSNGWITDTEVSPQAVERFKRARSELLLYKSQQLDNFLRALIFVINTLEQKEIVWGVGRGSSVSSYVLYLIGVHDVDSVEYKLDIADFLH
jgi:DNA polymerase III alpha subunit